MEIVSADIAAIILIFLKPYLTDPPTLCTQGWAGHWTMTMTWLIFSAPAQKKTKELERPILIGCSHEIWKVAMKAGFAAQASTPDAKRERRAALLVICPPAEWPRDYDSLDHERAIEWRARSTSRKHKPEEIIGKLREV
ncbi:hypothetical protein [Novosphingobium sp. Rr 2-17]|uniref:hypothetical protein n=1 Tax=Novosphingobium sp. Rr 2-17 TaxID=555793 RepID=UPI00063F1BEE|nr:hypothetical protein [Novosphingobium sp. Rr 2-17]